MSRSPLDDHLREINTLSECGYSNQMIASQMQKLHGIETSEAAIRRAKRRSKEILSLEAPESNFKRPWGLGGPATLDLPSPKRGNDYTVVGLSDIHGYWREQDLFDAALRLISDLGPDLVILLGDNVNFDIISRWQHSVLKKMTPYRIYKEIKHEVADWRSNILEPIVDSHSGLTISVEGNHCDRLRNYISDDLHEGWEEAKSILDPDELLDGYYNRAGVFFRPNYLAFHGDTTAQYPASKEYRDKKCSAWSGHLHTVHGHYEPPHPYTNENRHQIKLPGMLRLDYNYGPGGAGIARWHRGLAVGSFSAIDPEDHATDIGWWRNGKLRIRGELY